MESVFTSNATESPLLKRPVELRENIFKYALVIPREKRAWIMCRKEKGVVKATPSEQPTHCVALPRVSRQIYAETVTMFYAQNTFCFWTPGHLRKWLKQRILAQREAIRILYLYDRPYRYDRRVRQSWGETNPEVAMYPGFPRLVQEVKRSCANFDELKTDDVFARVIEEDNYNGSLSIYT
ncbi:hypothetical protein P171DRAFT_487423 [Karstenula rhodostoma CBS 690.94]|uniref:DUF7730 domain-containing protein n=1 Tax=Karstenula rhodostoma CBS 690.94 TaxID=1392251 RepID=A0A9P4PF25_9PLEO|nr:hypothetical protein P171DRAFT_487423 [Karstenula rhodostoma CBS 690.94]